ncbi:hypothetical protein DL764_005446 [Monosporascus ibericus]|uniref:PNPLA domain-containing protein n=1 Tax=Monosporascus ibericus TaxID=155417 RepID=A0A4Q4TAX4_9PEZI|nr:hypothetical protein DL764_005446 [Monosporascus ibericus]
MAGVLGQGLTQGTAAQPCQTCGTTKFKTFTCIQCNSLAFCETCWPRWILHVPGATGWGGKPHEKADPLVVQRLRQILEPIRSEADHQAELMEDEDTTWFGFGRDSAGNPIFQDHGRFAAVMGECRGGNIAGRYPQLVSFIGETGAGKSTLIKLLIDRQDLSSLGGSKYRSPVTSSNYDRIPTTGDVHLYADPSTFNTSAPMLFIDCEGLNGGESRPKGLWHISTENMPPGYLPPDPLEDSSPYFNNPATLLRSRYSAQRPIQWAKTPQTKKREYTVSQLYPRILYTFSDVVVFVLRNPRAFESTVLGKLLSWGAASIDKSLNQPVLPHAVIVLNATEDVHEDEWDVTTATNMLMSDIQGAILREPALEEYLETWRKRGKKISNTEQLLACYYASVTVIRIPTRGHYMLMDQQIAKLFELVKARCSESLLKKKQARMLANAEKLQLYLQAAFDHFSKDLDSPFDFVKEALRHNPVPRNFEGNILTLAVLIKDYSENDSLRITAKNIFMRMAPMIASCIMFDAVRQNLLGTAARLFDDAGGIRGIVQLQVLKAIERVLGPKLPIQHFFDLMVGTGTGGVIAIGLGVNRWSVNESIKKFKAIVKEAFTPRELTNMPIFGTLSSLLHRSVYKTQPLEKALKGYFDDQAFFGGVSVKSQHYTPAKVAVTATSVFDQQAVVLANYNRPDAVGEALPYEFIRYDTPTKELKNWEAARAAATTSPFFKPFYKPETGNRYLDGGLDHKNPIWVAHHETKLIWGDAAKSTPDLMLSIGTGSQVRDQVKPSNGRTSRATQASSGSSVHSGQQTIRTPLAIPVLSSTGSQRLHEYKECDRAWQRFMSGSSNHLQVADDSDQHYIRISPELLMPIPKFDQIHKMDEVEQEVEEVLQQMPEIREIAHRLIASSFFFEKNPGSIRHTSSGYMCTGKFRNSSDEMKALGAFLRSHLKNNFEPYFLIEEDSTRWPARQIILDEQTVDDMRLRGYFDIDNILIYASRENSATKISLGLQTTVYPSGVTVLPISGFPRQLMSEDVGRTAASDGASVLLNGRHSVGEDPPQLQQVVPIVHMESLSPVMAKSPVTAELPRSPPPPIELYGDSAQTDAQRTTASQGGRASELEGSSTMVNMI